MKMFFRRPETLFLVPSAQNIDFHGVLTQTEGLATLTTSPNAHNRQCRHGFPNLIPLRTRRFSGNLDRSLAPCIDYSTRKRQRNQCHSHASEDQRYITERILLTSFEKKWQVHLNPRILALVPEYLSRLRR